METLAAALARFVIGLDVNALPDAVLEKARVCILNAFGIALGSHDTPYAPVARTTAIAMDGEIANGSTLFGDGRRTTVRGACLANSALFHGRAQEDTCGAAHFGTILVPLLTALVEARGYPTSALLPALVAGYESGGLLEQAFGRTTTPGGFRSSAIYGTIAAAAAASKLMGLSESQCAAALANAVSFTGGVLQSFADGTDEWRYQVGVAAGNGLLAAELARAGSVSAPYAFEGKSGFIKAFARETADPTELAGRLGREWAMLRVTFKPYPVCAFNQTPVTGALAMRNRLEGCSIKDVRVRMNPFETGYAGMDAPGPFNTISGTLMSIPFCIATTLVHGVPDMRRMTTFDDETVNALVAQVRLVTDETVPTLSAIIEVDTADGRTLIHEQRMTTDDFSYDRAGVSLLIRRIGSEQNVPSLAYDRLEQFVEQLPGDAPIESVFDAFRMLPNK